MSSLGKRETGSIKWYNRKKGYGFIKPDNRDSAELFFHVSAIEPDRQPWGLSPGEDVEYSIESDEVGRLRAVQVTQRKGTCLVCGEVGHRDKDCKGIPPGQTVIRNHCGKWGHMVRSYGKKCFDCGEMGHIKVHCPRRQASSSHSESDTGRCFNCGWMGHVALYCPRRHASSSLGDSDVGRDADPELPGGGAGAGSDDEDDCVILENNPFVRREMQNLVWKKLIQNLVDEFCDVYSDRICKREEDLDKDENTYDCAVLENNQQEEESDDDCIILEKNPFEEEVHETIINMSNKLSLSSNIGTTFSVQQPSHSKLQSLKEEGLDHDELVVVAERGQVACRDYPHSRHLCVKHPFKDTPHHAYCNLCYCYVCDIKAPCKFWEAEKDGHCHASEREFKWIEMRQLNRINCLPNWHLNGGAI